MREVLAIAQRRGIAIGDEAIAHNVNMMDTVPPQFKPSMLSTWSAVAASKSSGYKVRWCVSAKRSVFPRP